MNSVPQKSSWLKLSAIIQVRKGKLDTELVNSQLELRANREQYNQIYIVWFCLNGCLSNLE